MNKLVASSNGLDNQLHGRFGEEESVGRYVSANNAIINPANESKSAVVRKAGQAVYEIGGQCKRNNK
jgi:hypothetical protein